MCLRGSSLMSCNPVSESLLFLWRAEAFSACTWFLDPMSRGRLRGYREVAYLQLEALRQALVGSAAALLLASRQWSVAVALSDRPSVSSSRRVLASLWYLRARFWKSAPSLTVLVTLIEKNWLMLLSLGLKRLTKAESCFQMLSQTKTKNYRCHLYWCSLCISCQMGNWAKTLKTH